MQRPALRAFVNKAGADVPIGPMRQGGTVSFEGAYITTEPALIQKCGEDSVQLTAQAAFEAQLGRSFDGLLVFGDSTNLGCAFAINEQPNRRVVVSQPMMPAGGDMAAWVAGTFDSTIQTAAAQLAANADKIIAVRIGWEFNIGGGYPWSVGGSGSNQTPANYVLLFQRWANYIRLVAPQLPLVWNPNFDSDPSSWYPGDAYCECVAIDAYVNSSFWTDHFDTVYSNVAGLRWMEGFAAAHGKMMGLGEWSTNFNTANVIPYVASWLKCPRQQRVLFQAYWNSNASFTGNLDGYPVAKAAYIAAFGM